MLAKKEMCLGSGGVGVVVSVSLTNGLNERFRLEFRLEKSGAKCWIGIAEFHT